MSRFAADISMLITPTVTIARNGTWRTILQNESRVELTTCWRQAAPSNRCAGRGAVVTGAGSDSAGALFFRPTAIGALRNRNAANVIPTTTMATASQISRFSSITPLSGTASPFFSATVQYRVRSANA